MKEQDLEKKLKRALHQPSIANENISENEAACKEEACQKRKKESVFHFHAF